MIFKKDTGADGIRFYALESEKFKASVLTFSISLPLSNESLAYSLLLSGLLRRGTKSYPTMAVLNKKLDELYGSYLEIRSSHIGNNISFTISSEILDNKYVPDGTDTLGGVIDIVSEILLHSSFKDGKLSCEVFEQERKIVLDSLNAETNNTRAYSVRRCMEILQLDTKHATLEQLKETVASATPESVLAYFEAMLSSAPLDVYYVGATDSSLIKERILSAFSDYPYKKASASLFPVSQTPKRELICKEEKMPVTQGKLTMGFNCGACISETDGTYYTAILMNELFGASPSSKLFLNVREKMGLCYYCSSSYSIYTGFMIVSSGIDSKKVDVTKSAILEQFEQIKLGNISSEELDKAKKSIFNSYEQLYDSPFDLQAFYSGRMLLSISATIEECKKRIGEVTAEMISALAKRTTLQAVFFVEGTKKYSEEEVPTDE